MNNAAQSYLDLVRFLRVDLESGGATARAKGVIASQADWAQILYLADTEHMTGALAVALRDQDLLGMIPKPIRAALARRSLMGAEISSRIRRQALEAVGLLNAAGVMPLILKGGLHFFEATPETLGTRVVRDLDIVVPTDRIYDCIESLHDAGYRPEGEDDGWTYHYRPMHHPNHLVPIELHIMPGEQRGFLTCEEAWAGAVPVACPGRKLVALAPEHRIAHNIFHSEIQDHGFALGAFSLRQLYDLAGICARFENDIAWDAILERMDRHGIGAPFRARLHMAVALLGAPVPAIAVGGLRSRLHLRRCFWQLRSQWLMNRARWIAGVLSRFNRYHIDLLYECGTTGLALQTSRCRHAWDIMRRHRFDFDKRLAENGRRLQ